MYVFKGVRPPGWHPPNRGPDTLSSKRVLFNEYVAGRLAFSFGSSEFHIALVPEPALIEISQTFIDQHRTEIDQMLPGVGHGSRWINKLPPPPATDMDSVNRTRLASLAVFIRWTGGSDFEFAFDADFGVIRMFDLGNFFGGPEWTLQSLRRDMEIRGEEQFSQLARQNSLTAEELCNALKSLHAVSREQIALAVASAPEGWDVTIPERVVLAKLLHSRQHQADP